MNPKEGAEAKSASGLLALHWSTWPAAYERSWFRADLVAGATLAAYAIPVSLAYASLAGLPPHYGVYCYLVGGLAYALFGTSRQLAIGPTAAISMMVGTTIAGMAEGDSARWAAIAALAALLTGVIAGFAWLLKLSGLVSFISETILTGFKAGAALTIGMTQLPKLFGVPGGGENFFERAWMLLGQLGQTHGVTLIIGLAAIGLLVFGERKFPGRPIALSVVALAILTSWLASMEENGVATVGAIPAGLPHFAWPSLRFRDVDGILPLAAACFLLSYVESVSAARTLASKHGYDVDPRQELFAIGAANAAAAFFQGYPIAGGLSQSAVNEKAGAKSPLALVFASAAIGVCMLLLTGLLAKLPSVVLAAIVLVAVRGLFDVAALRRLQRVSRFEFSIAMVALAGVLLLGILKGVLLAVIASLLVLLAAAAHPHVAFLGRDDGLGRFSDMQRNLDSRPIEGVLIFRIEASLLYFNVEHVKQAVWSKVLASGPLRLAVCDLSNSPYVDVAGAGMLTALRRNLAGRGADLLIAGAHSHNRDLLRAEGLCERGGAYGPGASLEQVVSASA